MLNKYLMSKKPLTFTMPPLSQPERLKKDWHNNLTTYEKTK